MPARKKKADINLLITERPELSFSSQLTAWMFTYGRYIIIITQIVVLSVFFARFKLDRDHTDLKESVSQKQAILESVKDLENEIVNIQNKLVLIRNTTINQDSIPRVLRFLQDNTPTDTTYSTLSINTDRITFIASAGSLRSFSFLLSRLQQNDRFLEVTLEDILRRPNGRVEFQIHARINVSVFYEEKNS